MAKCGRTNNFCSNKITYDIQRGGIDVEPDYYDMKKDTFTAFTGTAIALTNALNFIVGVFVNGVRYEEGIDFTVSGTNITFVETQTDSTVVAIYF